MDGSRVRDSGRAPSYRCGFRLEPSATLIVAQASWICVGWRCASVLKQEDRRHDGSGVNVSHISLPAHAGPVGPKTTGLRMVVALVSAAGVSK